MSGHSSAPTEQIAWGLRWIRANYDRRWRTRARARLALWWERTWRR